MFVTSRSGCGTLLVNFWSICWCSLWSLPSHSLSTKVLSRAAVSLVQPRMTTTAIHNSLIWFFATGSCVYTSTGIFSDFNHPTLTSLTLYMDYHTRLGVAWRVWVWCNRDPVWVASSATLQFPIRTGSFCDVFVLLDWNVEDYFY